MPEIPDLPDPLDAPPDPLPELTPSQLRVQLHLPGWESAAELVRLKERVSTLEAAHRKALADYREELDHVAEKLREERDLGQRARNECDVMARALRELVEACPGLMMGHYTSAEVARYGTALRQAREVLTLWGRK